MAMPYGWLREYMGRNVEKKCTASAMLGTATVSGRLARTDRVYIGLDGPAGLAAGRALRSAPQALPALREQPEHARRTRRYTQTFS